MLLNRTQWFKYKKNMIKCKSYLNLFFFILLLQIFVTLFEHKYLSLIHSLVHHFIFLVFTFKNTQNSKHVKS